MQLRNFPSHPRLANVLFHAPTHFNLLYRSLPSSGLQHSDCGPVHYSHVGSAPTCQAYSKTTTYSCNKRPQCQSLLTRDEDIATVRLSKSIERLVFFVCDGAWAHVNIMHNRHVAHPLHHHGWTCCTEHYRAWQMRCRIPICRSL
jgi:hypothetical protein